MRRIGLVALATGLVLAVGGCSGDEPAGGPGGNAGAADAAATDQAPGAGNHVEELGGATVAFGDPAEYDDGLAIVVAEPQRFEPSAGATTDGGDDFVKLAVRLVNRSDQKVSPADIALMVESGGGQAGDVLDAEQQMSGPPAKAVKPGGKARWVQGFSVLDPDEVSVVVQAGTERVPVEFRSGKR